MKLLIVILSLCGLLAFSNHSAPFSERANIMDTAPYFGVYPYSFQQTWGLNIGRRVVYASTWSGSGTAYTDTVLLNVDWNWNHTYGKDSARYGVKCLQIYNRLHPKMIVCENEELLHGDLTQYIKNLKAAAWRLGANKVTNGGITMLELGKWYYKVTGDTGYLNRNCTAPVKAGLLAGDFDSDSSRVHSLLLAIKNTPTITLWNVHFYFGYPQQCQGIVRCIKYVNTFTGKRAMSNEFGTYSSVAAMKDSAISITRQTKMYWGVVYSGTGMIGKSVPWTQTAFITSTQ